MAEKKMTQVEALEIAAQAMEDIDVEVADILMDMADKRRAPRKPRVNKDAEAFRAELITVLRVAEGPVTNAELTVAMREHLEDEDIKPQKVANIIRVLEKDGVVTRVRGEKPSDKDTFILT